MTKMLLAGAACALLLAACNEQANEGVDVGDKAQDMAAAPVGQVSAATMGSNLVSAFVPNAAMSDMYEIQAADIALAKSQNAQVKELATMIKADHTASSEKMKSLVPTAAPGVALPTELDQRRKGLIDNLNSATPAQFDMVYVDQQIAAHQEALTLLRGFADNTEAPQLAEHARMTIPKIEAHLQKAQQIKASMG